MLLIDLQRLHSPRRWPREPFDPRGFSERDACPAQPNQDTLARYNRVQTAQQYRQAQAAHHLERRWLL